jgi:hypothetical protein
MPKRVQDKDTNAEVTYLPAIEDLVKSPTLKAFTLPESKDTCVQLASAFGNRESARWLFPPVECSNASKSYQAEFKSLASPLLIVPLLVIAMETKKREYSVQTYVKSPQDVVRLRHRG